MSTDSQPEKNIEGNDDPFFGVENGQNGQNHDFAELDEIGSESWIEKALAAGRVLEAVMEEVHGEERMEQERTVRAKEKFLEVYEKTMGTITLACDQAGVARSQYYHWMQTDSEFRAKVYGLEDSKTSMVQDRLMKLIQQDDGPSIRFYLKAKDPEFNPASKVEVVTGTRTFEDLLYEAAEEELAKEKGEAEDAESNEQSHDTVQ